MKFAEAAQFVFVSATVALTDRSHDSDQKYQMSSTSRVGVVVHRVQLISTSPIFVSSLRIHLG